MPEQDFADTIHDYFPYDGPHDRDKVVDAAYGLSGLTRYLNNATGPWNSTTTLDWGATLHSTISALHATTTGFDQLLHQLSEAGQRLASDPTLYDDRRSDLHPAARTAREVALLLDEAHNALGVVTSKLGDVHSLSSHLGKD
jgi:hypothetical protein